MCEAACGCRPVDAVVPFPTARRESFVGGVPVVRIRSTESCPMVNPRTYCRNPHCRSKLPSPVDNPRTAFCLRACYDSYFLKRCIVCERHKERLRTDFADAAFAGTSFGEHRTLLRIPGARNPTPRLHKRPYLQPASSRTREMPILRRLFGAIEPVEDGAGKRPARLTACWTAKTGSRPGLRAAAAMAVGGLSIPEPFRFRPPFLILRLRSGGLVTWPCAPCRWTRRLRLVSEP